MSALRVGSLFSGTGALDLAAEEVFGASPAWFCEYDKAPSRILAHHWPAVPNFGDVTTIDWAAVEPVDILTAGYPCQPFSLAGSRKGQSDVRHLWPFVAEAISFLRPRYVLLENVRGHLSMGFGDVLGDLAGLGYDAQWCVIRASAAGAPHRRERIFILAQDTNCQPREQWGQSAPGQTEGWRSRPDTRGSNRASATGDPAQNSDGCGSAGRFEESSPARGDRSAPGPDPRSHAIRADRTTWGIFAEAVARWELITGRPAPRPVVATGRAGRDRLNPELPEWMMGFDKGHITGVPGLSWGDMLKAAGNGVVKQQAVMAYRHLLEVAAL